MKVNQCAYKAKFTFKRKASQPRLHLHNSPIQPQTGGAFFVSEISQIRDTLQDHQCANAIYHTFDFLSFLASSAN